MNTQSKIRSNLQLQLNFFQKKEPMIVSA